MTLAEVSKHHHEDMATGIVNRMRKIVEVVGQQDNHWIRNTPKGILIDRFDQQAQFRVIVTEDVMHVFSEKLGEDGETVTAVSNMGCKDHHIGGEVMILANVMQLISDSVNWPGVTYETQGA